MVTRKINSITVVYDPSELETVEVISDAVERSLHLIHESWGIGKSGRLLDLCHDLMAGIFLPICSLALAYFVSHNIPVLVFPRQTDMALQCCLDPEVWR